MPLYSRKLLLSNYLRPGREPIEVRSTAPLSNLFRTNTPIQDRFGIGYPTVEHAYRAAHLDPSHPSVQAARRELLTLDAGGEKPGLALAGSRGRALLAQIAARHNVPILSPTPEYRTGVMSGILRQKFSDPEFAAFLSATHPRHIYEKDHPFWGLPGENRLGRLLMGMRTPDPVSGFLNPPDPLLPGADLWKPSLSPLTPADLSSLNAKIQQGRPINIGRRGWGDLNGWFGNYAGPLYGPGNFKDWAPAYTQQLQEQMKDPVFRTGLETLRRLKAELWCPGCKQNSCRSGICHGSILQSSP